MRQKFSHSTQKKESGAPGQVGEQRKECAVHTKIILVRTTIHAKRRDVASSVDPNSDRVRELAGIRRKGRATDTSGNFRLPPQHFLRSISAGHTPASTMDGIDRSKHPSVKRAITSIV